MNRFFVYLIFFFTGCSMKPLMYAPGCKELDLELKKSFIRSSESRIATTSDSLMNEIKEKYSNCFIGKDTSQIVELLGSNYILSIPLFGKVLKDSLGLKMMMIYYVATPKRPMKAEKKDGWQLNLGADSLNIIRTVRIELYSY